MICVQVCFFACIVVLKYSDLDWTVFVGGVKSIRNSQMSNHAFVDCWGEDGLSFLWIFTREDYNL
jgi:hypothetical protein